MAQSKSQHARREHQFAMVKAELDDTRKRIAHALALHRSVPPQMVPYPLREKFEAIGDVLRAALTGEGGR